MEFAIDRLEVLIDQYDSAQRAARDRLTGLSDAEYRWEPVAPMWSIRRRTDAVGSMAYGPGAWRLDFDRSPAEPPPVTTIAWRLGHLTSGLAGRWEWTFGDRAAAPETIVDFAPTADGALELWWSWADRWRAGLVSVTPEQADQVGFGQYPWGLDPTVPFVAIMWWTNQEIIHHLAEVALLRDLWRAGHR